MAGGGVKLSADTKQFRALGAAVKGADKDLRRELFKAVSTAAQPVRREIPESARRVLPRSGGLGDWVADSTITIRQTYSGRNPGVTIKMEKVKTTTHRLRNDLVGPLLPGQGRTRTVRRRKAGTFGAKSDLPRIDRGRVAHPAWGRMPASGHLIYQNVEPGFFTLVMRGTLAARARREILSALKQFNRNVSRRIRSAA